MNFYHIQKAIAGSPPNVQYLEQSFAQMLSSDEEDISSPADTVIIMGVAGYIDEDTLEDLLRVASIHGADDMRLAFNYPNALIWKERTIYRDAIARAGRNKQLALRIVAAIAAFHPSETVRRYGETLLTSDSEQRHMLLAPHFNPIYSWEAEELLDNSGFSLIESRTSALALEPSAADLIKSEFRWEVYGRKSV
jgi:hypothetical protein